MYQLKKIHQETQVLQLPRHKQIILLVLVDQPHMLQVKIQLQRLIPQQHLQPRIQRHGILVHLLQDQHQLQKVQLLIIILVRVLLQHLILHKVHQQVDPLQHRGIQQEQHIIILQFY